MLLCRKIGRRVEIWLCHPTVTPTMTNLTKAKAPKMPKNDVQPRKAKIRKKRQIARSFSYTLKIPVSKSNPF